MIVAWFERYESLLSIHAKIVEFELFVAILHSILNKHANHLVNNHETLIECNSQVLIAIHHIFRE